MNPSVVESERAEKKTGALYGAIFPAIVEADSKKLAQFVSTDSLGEARDFFQGKRVLDLGCGGLGYAIAGFARQGAAEIIGIDLSSENIERLRERFRGLPVVRLIRHDICRLEELDLGAVDFVYSSGVIHHTKDPDKIVRDARELLEPGGKIVVSLYGKGGLIPFLIKIARIVGRLVPQRWLRAMLEAISPASVFYVMDYVYVPIQRRYTEEEAKRLLEEAGFRAVVRLRNPIFETRRFRRALMQTQSDPGKPLSRLLHGHGFIIVKGIK